MSGSFTGRRLSTPVLHAVIPARFAGSCELPASAVLAHAAAVLSGVAGGKVERTDVVTTPGDAQPSLLGGPQEAAVFDVEPFVASSSPSNVVTAASAFAFLSAPKPIRRRSSAFSPCRA